MSCCRIITGAVPISRSKLEKSRPFSSSSSLTVVGRVWLNSNSLCLGSNSKRSSHLYPFSDSDSRATKQICRAAEYKFPDPIPEFADQETKKFRTHLLSKLSQREVYEDSAEEVVDICTEIFSTFMHAEYGGPGTLLVVPFIEMAETVHERGLPGASQAARAAVKWAQKNVDKDWKDWTGTD